MTVRLLSGVAIGIAAIGAIVLAAQTRDGGLVTSGSAVIRGAVLTDDAQPRPLRRAIVTVAGSSLPASRSAVTDDEGRFVVGGLPPGRFMITSIKRGYVAGAYGARRPGRPGTPAELAAGQTFDATIHMAPAGVVTGLIRDESGDPIPGLRVFVVDAASPTVPLLIGSRRAGTTGNGVDTDDRGIYRVFDLAPGTYLVAAAPTTFINGDIVRRSVAEVDTALAGLRGRAGQPSPSTGAPPASRRTETLAVNFYPGTAVMADATPVTIGRGETRDGLDFVVAAVPVTTIEGTVVGADGPALASVEMSIIPANTLQLFALSSVNPQLSRRPNADGRFTYTNTVPGRYTILARVTGVPTGDPVSGRAGAPAAVTGRGGAVGLRGAQTPDAVYATETVEVTGQPVSGVTLRLQPGSRLSGRITFDAATLTVPGDLTAIRVGIQPVTSSTWVGAVIGSASGSSASTGVRANGTFEIAGIAPGRYRLTATVPAEPGQSWWLRSAVIADRDILDSTLESSLGADQTNALLTLTDRRSELSGTLQTSGGLPAPDYSVVVFPTDPSLRSSTRRTLSTRPGTDGRFSLADLPAGEYFIVAMTDVEPNEWQRPEFLARVAPAGIKVTLGHGERKVQDLRIAAHPVAPGSR